MLMVVQVMLVALERDFGWILAGVAGVIVAVAPLTVLVFVARPRNRVARRLSSRTRGRAAALVSLSHFPFSRTQQANVSTDDGSRKRINIHG